MAEMINAFKMAQTQFDHVAGQLNLDPQVAELLRWPAREFKFQVPVRMDDGTLRLFTGYRVQHSEGRGRGLYVVSGGRRGEQWRRRFRRREF